MIKQLMGTRSQAAHVSARLEKIGDGGGRVLWFAVALLSSNAKLARLGERWGCRISIFGCSMTILVLSWHVNHLIRPTAGHIYSHRGAM